MLQCSILMVVPSIMRRWARAGRCKDKGLWIRWRRVLGRSALIPGFGCADES
jgi:hypothetical protein